VARQKPYSIWERLAETGIFPYQTCGLGSTDDSNINPGEKAIDLFKSLNLR